MKKKSISNITNKIDCPFTAQHQYLPVAIDSSSNAAFGLPEA